MQAAEVQAEAKAEVEVNEKMVVNEARAAVREEVHLEVAAAVKAEVKTAVIEAVMAEVR